MLEQLITIENQKQQYKKQTQQYKNSCLCAIYGGLVKNKTSKEIGKELYNLTINQAKQGKYVEPNVYKNSLVLLNKIKKKLPSETNLVETAQLKYPHDKVENKTDATALLVFGLFDLLNAGRYITKDLNKNLNELEGKRKEQVAEEEIDKNRLLTQPRVFYLASSHDDCASDHYDYQGKIYIDESWKDYVKDQTVKTLIARYVERHNTRTLQWVMHKPVWFITRPNCRHYVQAIPTDRVLGAKSIGELARAYKTHRAVGNRQYLQTLKSGKDRKVIGELRNAELMIDKYMERRLEHQKIYQTYKSVLVKRAIAKDTQLINKWQNYKKLLEKSG